MPSVLGGDGGIYSIFAHIAYNIGLMDGHMINLIASPVCGRCYTLPGSHPLAWVEIGTRFGFEAPESHLWS